MGRQTEDLEDLIEADRERLDEALQQLSATLTPEALSRSAAREMVSRSDALSQGAVNIARANPAGALLAGVGLAALLLGPKQPKQERKNDAPRQRTAQGRSATDKFSPACDHSAEAATYDTPAPNAKTLRAALNSGLANLPGPSRNRVIAARKAAIDVQEKIDRQAAIGARKAKSFHQRQPFTTAALAAGAGVLVAAMFSRTRTEDALLGPKRDALMKRAELVLQEEIESAAATAEAALRHGNAGG